MQFEVKQLKFRAFAVAAMLAASSLVVACGDDDSDDKTSANGGKFSSGGSSSGGKSGSESGGAPDAEASGGNGGEVSNDASLFAVPTQVYGADFATSTSYVPIVPSLDVDRIDIDDAREFDGRASVAVVGKWLFIASSSSPVVQRFEVAAGGELTAAGSLNFSNYGVPEYFSIDAWGAVFVNAEKAYIFNGSDGSHVVWNPTTLKVIGEIPAPGVVKAGYNLESVAVVRGNRMYRIFTLLNYDSWEFLPEPQYLAVYDVESDKLLDLVQEDRCPQLYSRPFVDEVGDIYFSGWVWTPGLTLTSDYPASCALRIRADEDTFDRDWQLDFAADVTEGREAGILRYLGNGRALLDVFHDERVTIDSDTDAQELSNTANWRLWSIDLGTKQGAPVEDLDYKAGGYTDVQVDGRTFLMVPNGDYSETTAYEMDGEQIVEGFKIQGSSYHMVKLR